MDAHSDPTENVDPSLLNDSTPSQSANEDINSLISGNRVFYNFDPLETFPEIELRPSGSFYRVNIIFIRIFEFIDPINVYLHRQTADLHLTRTIIPIYNPRTAAEQLAITKSSNDPLPANRSTTEKPPVALSNSIDISTCQQRRVQLIYPLEDIYRPRYKSDYFPQNGVVRRPRYIADSAGNHFITLQLPSEYQYDLHNYYIRVALITQLIEGHGHYYSPYKFQKDHNDIRIPDENPTFIKVETSQEDNFTMRLQLVLIKSKLDHLNNVQPLKLFSDTTTSTRHIVHEEKLAPKDLITRYQLDKSRIAFTLCTKLPDGTYQLHPDTTVISSVITEASTTKRSNESTAAPTVESAQNVCCPHCSHHFDPDTPSQSSESSEPKPTHSKTSRSRSCATTENRSKKKKKKP